MDQDDKVVVLKIPITPGEADKVPSGSSEKPQPLDIHLPSYDRALPVSAVSMKLAGQEPTAMDPLAALKEAVGVSQAAADVQTAQMPEIKVPPRETTEQPTEPRRGRKLRLMAGVCAVFGVGWLVGLNTSSVDLNRATNWMHQGVGALNTALWSVEKELEERFAELTNWNTPVVEASQAASPEMPNKTDALEQAIQALTIKLDQMQASSEGLSRDIRADVEGLKASIERSQAELTSKLAQVVERIEQQKASPPVAAVAQKPEQVAALAPTAPAPSTVQRPAPEADAKPTSSPAAPPLRREPTVIKQWTVREVLNGMALLEGPRGLVGVSPGQTVPGVGRVEAITRQESRWVVATTNGVITGREGLR